MRQGTTQHHGIHQDPDRPEHSDNEEEPERDGAAPRGCGGSTRVTRSQIYRYWLQVSPFHSFQTSALASVKLRVLALYIFLYRILRSSIIFLLRSAAPLLYYLSNAPVSAGYVALHSSGYRRRRRWLRKTRVG